MAASFGKTGPGVPPNPPRLSTTTSFSAKSPAERSDRDGKGSANATPTRASPIPSLSSAKESTPTTSISGSAPQLAIRPIAAPRPAPPKTTAAPINKMSMASVISPNPSMQPRPLSMTTKEWVVPPRPKPGRKPATDTPPTKRKAQNRAAQRAFRERRAARVGELEEQLQEQKEDHDRTIGELQERVTHLEAENQSLQSRCEWLEGLLEKERQSRDSIARPWSGDDQRSVRFRESSVSSHPRTGSFGGSHVPGSLSQKMETHGMMTSFSLPRPRPAAQAFSIAQIISPPEEVGSPPIDLSCGSCVPNGPCACAEEALAHTTSIGCGKCSMGSRCDCLEESIRETSRLTELKRPLPPASPASIGPEEKRQRSDVDTVMETDTVLYATNKRDTSATPSELASNQPPPVDTSESKDPCGFCTDGTYCVCADSAMTVVLPPPNTAQLAMSQQVHTPPPSESDMIPSPVEVTATGAIKLPGVRSLQGHRAKAAFNSSQPAKTGGCGLNGPGTCAQCLADPKSGLFCRSLAANYERSSRASDGGCCGKSGPGGCCKSGNVANKNVATAGLGLSLSCAEAYKTLSSHRHFDEAADDIGSWLPKLKIAPATQQQQDARSGGPSKKSTASVPGTLAPIEVEAASIMSVLKGFDVRFGRGQ